MTAVVAATAVTLSIAWACGGVALPPAPVYSGAESIPAKSEPLAPERWMVDLWRPLVDAPAVAVAAPPPPSVRLFSIMKRGGAHVAALDLGGSDGLAYVKAGESRGAITVVAIDAAGADIAINGQRQRLELAK